MLKATIFIATLIFFTGCSQDSKQETTTPVEVKKAIPKGQYTLRGLDDKSFVVQKTKDGFTLKGAKGKVILFDIYATWCPPCRASALHLSSLQEKYKDSLVIIGIHTEGKIPNSKLQDFREKYNANYTLVNSEQNRPLADSIVKSLNLGDRYPIPTIALYKDGKYINHYIGTIEEEFLQNDIKLALGKE